MGSQTQELLFLGFDLSTQQLKGLVVDSQLKLHYQAIVDFDQDAKDYGIEKGTLTNSNEGEVYAPVAMWLRAIDIVLERLKGQGLDFSNLKGISGAGMQHGSVFWSFEGEEDLQTLDPSKNLEGQLSKAFAYPYSPNWQDASTQAECDQFDQELGSPEELAKHTGSKAHHRFTGPQILRLRKKRPESYKKTARISLVSSWIASIFLGKIAPIDFSDVCGMNLWDIPGGDYNPKLMELVSGGDAAGLERKLHQPCSVDTILGKVSQYFVKRWGFSADCSIAPSTGDNPSTILALPLQANDAMVSLGTSTTFLMSTPAFAPDPAIHFFNHPASSNLYMFMLCYKNGGLAREEVRNALDSSKSWDAFNKAALDTPILAAKSEDDKAHIGLYFPRPEIVPNVHEGTWRYLYNSKLKKLEETGARKDERGQEDARLIVESQFLSLRLRSRNLVSKPRNDLPAQPRRIYLVGGGSVNPAIAQLAGEVLGGAEGVYRLDVGGNACALGAAYRATWAVERTGDESFEDFIEKRWDEDQFVKKVDQGYRKGTFEKYALGVEALVAAEREVLSKVKREAETEHERKDEGIRKA